MVNSVIYYLLINKVIEIRVISVYRVAGVKGIIRDFYTLE